MPIANFKPKGDPVKMLRKLKNFEEKFPKQIESALYKEVEIEVKEVKRRTPVDKGHLRASVHQVGPLYRGKLLYTLIVAGGVAAPYALIVHEDLEAFHKVGQAKYIESVIMESRPYMAARIAKRINLAKAIGG